MRYCWEELANAIVLQSVEDYRTASRQAKRYADAARPMARVRECERFFRSGWFRVLTGIDGRRLLEELKEEEV